MPWYNQQAYEFLNSLENFGVHLGLGRMTLLLEQLGNPQANFRAVHVVGTNGKSSTAHMSTAIIGAHGFKVGTYTSPHIYGFCDRVCIDGQALPEPQFTRYLKLVVRAAKEIDPQLDEGEQVTQFEVLTAAAFLAFSDQKVDVAVVEAGLGGRLDATNVIDADVVVLTNIALEHTNWLGSSEREICSEKLAVISDGAQLVAGPLSRELISLAETTAFESGAGALFFQGRDFDWQSTGNRLTVSGRQQYTDIELETRALFQQQNFALAVISSERLLGRLEIEKVRSVAQRASVAGRFEIKQEDPRVIYDGAHNPAAVQALRQSLTELGDHGPFIFVISFLQDKDISASVGKLAEIADEVICTASSSPRSLPAQELANVCGEFSGIGRVATVLDPAAAVEMAKRIGSESSGTVVVTGSFYLLRDLEQTNGRVVGLAA